MKSISGGVSDLSVRRIYFPSHAMFGQGLSSASVQCIFWAGWGGSVTPPKFSPEIWAGGGGQFFQLGLRCFLGVV